MLKGLAIIVVIFMAIIMISRYLLSNPLHTFQALIVFFVRAVFMAFISVAAIVGLV